MFAIQPERIDQSTLTTLYYIKLNPHHSKAIADVYSQVITRVVGENCGCSESVRAMALESTNLSAIKRESGI